MELENCKERMHHRIHPGLGGGAWRGLFSESAALESLDTLRASPEMEIFREVEQDESVIERVTAVQREELETEITGLQTEAE